MIAAASRTSTLALFGQRDTDPDSAGFGRWVAAGVGDARRVVLDLTGLGAADGGAGLLSEARDALAGREVIGIVDAEELDLPATGINLRAQPSGPTPPEPTSPMCWPRTPGCAPGPRVWARVWPPDPVAERPVAWLWPSSVSTDGSSPGQHYCHELASLGQTMAASDLVVTGTTSIGALERGGPVVAQVAAWAGEALRPCLAFTTGDALSRRELRTFGIEAAYSLDPDPSSEQLTALAARVASGWAGGASADA